MPVHCPITITAITAEEFGPLDYAVMKHMFASHNEIGRLADERVYRSDVAQRLTDAGLQNCQETPVQLTYKSFEKRLWLDLVVSSKAVYELKSTSSLHARHETQLLTYLYLLDLPRGKLINFRPAKIHSKYVNAPIPSHERREFLVDVKDYWGEADLPILIVDLLRDWGTALSLSLYREAITHLLGGEEIVEQMIPLSHNGKQLTTQRFHLLDSMNAFELTAFSRPDHGYGTQLKKLLQLSPLRAVQWINIGVHCVTFTTITA